MKRNKELTHEFVEFIPAELQEGVLYVSIAYATAVHQCCCGCRQEVVTPLSPTDWTVVFDGETVSLDPSIGNWSFACQSHYWIRRNRVRWAPVWSRERIELGRSYDRATKDHLFEGSNPTVEKEASSIAPSQQGWWQRFKRWWSNKS